MTDDDKPVLTELAVRSRITEYDDERLEVSSVYCPRTRQAMSVEDCVRCPHFVSCGSVGGAEASLRCVVPAASVSEERPLGLEPLLQQTQVKDVMTAHVTCVDSELGLDALARLFEREHVAAAPVVEDQGVLLGMVSKSDLKGERLAETGPVDLIVDDVMAQHVAMLREEDSMAQGVKVLAGGRAHQLPVVDHRERVVGILSAMDVLRWLAKHLATQ